jgi:transposase-like protein
MKTAAPLLPFNSFAQMLSALPTDESCREYLEAIRWSGAPVCPHCGTANTNHYKLKTKGEFKGLYKCRDCKERFTVTVGTMFEGSHIPIRKWFIALYIFSSHKKGISSHQLASDLGITQKSAWFMLGRMRAAFSIDKPTDLGSVVQADESFVGGKNKNRHADKKAEESQGRSTKDKTPVLGMVGSTDKVHTTVVADTKAKTLKPIIENLVSNGSIIVTDEWQAYKGLANNYAHIVVNHKENQYVSGAFHTNGIENFWSLLKRGIYGIYHHASPKHLHRYCDEFAFRFNARKESNNERFNFPLINSPKLTYQELIAK